MFRSLSKESQSFKDIKLHFPDIEVSAFLVEKGSPIIGKTLQELNLRKKFGANIIGVTCEDGFVSNPTAEYKVSDGDTLFPW